MLTATPKGCFSQNYSLSRDAHRLADLDLSLWKEKADVTIGDRRLRIYKEGVLKPTFVLELDGRVLAKAAKPSIFRDRLELLMDGVVCEVRRKSLFSQAFTVWRGEEQIGRIWREGWFTRKTQIALPEDWPVALQVFVFWLVLILWKRDESAAV